MKPNQYQSAIVEWVREGRGHAAVSAVAGSGKTTTLVNLVAPQLRGRALFVAFNKSIAGELGRKLRGTPVQSSTIHSAGLRALGTVWDRHPKIDGGKLRRVVKDLLWEVKDGQYPASKEVKDVVKGTKRASLASALVKAYDLARLTMLVNATDTLPVVDEGAIAEMCMHFGVDAGGLPLSDWLPLLFEVEARSLNLAREGVIDFSDMVWLPAIGEVPGVGPVTLPTYDWLLVDEAQDLNRCQMTFVQRLLGPGGRMLVVGDPRQAIYGFAGADSKAFGNLVEALDAEVLPLSVCYRCPTSHVKLAQEDVEYIEAAPGAAEGELVQGVSATALVDKVHEGDLVLCRTTAPLVKHALQAIRAGIPASVKGRDIGKGLIRLLDMAAGDVRDLDTAMGRVDAYVDQEIAKLAKREGTEGKQMALDDQRMALWAIADNCESVLGVKQFIESLFRDDRGSVLFSTIHRAKGLEAERVHLLRPDLLPHPMAVQDWEVEQEMNLRYVARTRAKQSLTVYG